MKKTVASIIACLSLVYGQKFFSKVDVFEEYVKTNESPDKGYTFVKQNGPNEFGKLFFLLFL
jgi:uncharacterized protein YxeA